MERKEKFYEQFNQFLKTRKYVSLNSYEKIVRIKEFLQNPPDERSKTAEEYNWIKRLYLKDVAGSIEVYYKSDNRQMVALEEVFDLIDAAHAKTKHGGRDILKYACKNFAGIPQEAFQMYLNLCEQCELKKARVKKGLVVKPILSEEMNSRSQLDLIDMQAQEYQGFKYVMAYQSKVGEDEAEMLSIKLRTGELVRLKKKVEPMVENELEEEEDDKSEAKTKVDEEDFSNLSASELLAKRRELLEEIRGKIASAAHALTINPHENVCIDRLGTKQGILPQLYTRNQFSPASADYLQKEEVPPTVATLRSTAIASSSVGGQGFLYCNCTQKCGSQRCKCVRSGFKCTSKCHNSLACKNK